MLDTFPSLFAPQSHPSAWNFLRMRKFCWWHAELEGAMALRIDRSVRCGAFREPLQELFYPDVKPGPSVHLGAGPGFPRCRSSEVLRDPSVNLNGAVCEAKHTHVPAFDGRHTLRLASSNSVVLGDHPLQHAPVCLLISELGTRQT